MGPPLGGTPFISGDQGTYSVRPPSAAQAEEAPISMIAANSRITARAIATS
jgi:hypothetical protein